MARDKAADDAGDGQRHDRARDLGEEALEALDEGDEARADRLIDQAKQLDETALHEIVEELDEAAGSDPQER